ncbi:MAG: hypothetical protein EAZ09_01140 [Oscillatoriales cyanobacterium]|nr:MAG: hypothetical protein EAZ18_23135 [Oscillatoriales cyanobacterium]TAH26206.1 MAG: hypothetical protein EAZ09_01140 [Oscillatoriales cyanobacterium]
MGIGNWPNRALGIRHWELGIGQTGHWASGIGQTGHWPNRALAKQGIERSRNAPKKKTKPPWRLL